MKKRGWLLAALFFIAILGSQLAVDCQQIAADSIVLPNPNNGTVSIGSGDDANISSGINLDNYGTIDNDGTHIVYDAESFMISIDWLPVGFNYRDLNPFADSGGLPAPPTLFRAFGEGSKSGQLIGRAISA